MKKYLPQILLILFCNTFAQSPFQNIRINSASSTNPEEVSIAINPIDPTNLIAGANIRYVYRSTNSGQTWTQANLSSQYGVWGDPAIIFDVNGNAYYAHLSNPSSPGYWIDRIVVQKSTDKGATWDQGYGVGFNPPTKNQDKEWLIVDHTNSQFRNNIYMSWTEFDNYGSSNSLDSSRIVFSRSTNSGVSWSAPVKVSDRSGNCIDSDNTVEGAVPAVGPNGEVYTCWAGPLGLMFDRSLDGGVSWGNDIFVSDLPGGWDITIPGIQRCNGFPVTVCDISNSPNRGTIYINWSDQRNGINNTDIFLAKSTNGGLSWSAPIKVNQDTSNHHQFFNWMTIDPATGIIYIVYYDRRNYLDSQTDVYLARSDDGGNTFTETRISNLPFSPVMSVFFGDYINIASFNGKIFPIWTRMEGTSLSIWTAPIIDADLIVPVELVSFNGSFFNNYVQLNWTTASENNNKGFEVEKSVGNNQSVVSSWETIGFVSGLGTTTEKQDYSFADNNLSSGKSFYRLKQIDFDGTFEYSNTIEINATLPNEFVLYQNYPNPFNPSTVISYQLSASRNVTLKIYDVLGNEVATLINNEWKEAGYYNYPFSIINYQLPSGIYFYRLQSGEFISTKKLVLMK